VSSGLVKSILTDLNDWTWLAVEYRVWLIILATVIGLLVPLVAAARRDMPKPAPSLVVRSGAIGLGLSSALMAICALLHFSDLRWLAPSQRGSVHVSAPGGVFGFAKPAVGVIHRRELAIAQDPEAERERLADLYAEAQLRPQVAARTGYVDELIEPGETRARLVWALNSLAGSR